METPPNCPLDLDTYTGTRTPMLLSHLSAIENHVSSNDCVNCPHLPLKEFIFDGCVIGTTPLLLACHYGNFDSVKRIVESWGADVRTTATYYIIPSRNDIALRMKIESATPLFVAALQGYSKIVQYLLEKGADVAAKASSKAKPEYDGFTPLDGAVSDHSLRRYPQDEQRLERSVIVLSLLEFGADISTSNKPLWMNNLCGFDTTMTLINHGMDLKQRDPSSGRTVLHHWASSYHDCTEEDSLTIVKLLIEKGADVMARDNFGFTPIMTAANRIDPRYHLDLGPLDFLLKRDDISIVEKIEAMELAGANILSEDRNSPHPKACYYWRRATHLRQTEGSGSYQKKLIQKSLGTMEWTTSDQLKHLLQHPTKSSSNYEIKIQSLLVQLRILSSRSWEAVNHFLEKYLHDSDLAFMPCEKKYLELLDIYWAILDTILLFKPSEKGLWNKSVGVVSSLIDTLSDLKSSNPTLLNSKIIKKSIHLILASDQSFRLSDREMEPQTETVYERRERERDTYIKNQYSSTMFHFLHILLELPEMPDDLWGSLPQLFIRHIESDEIGSLLLQACKDYKNVYYSAIIRLLLQLGANVDTADEVGSAGLACRQTRQLPEARKKIARKRPTKGLKRVQKLGSLQALPKVRSTPNPALEVGNRPLHLVAQSDRKQSEAAGCLLIGYGAQLFRTNNSGKTAVDLWIERNELEDDHEREEGAAEPFGRPDWCRTVRKLKCLSASCIRVHDVPYEDEPEFFQGSHSFIEKH